MIIMRDILEVHLITATKYIHQILMQLSLIALHTKQVIPLTFENLIGNLCLTTDGINSYNTPFSTNKSSNAGIAVISFE